MIKIVNVKNKAKYARLFAAAEALKKLKPWNSMYEDQLFAVEFDKQQIKFCSIMGANKEVYALAIYEDIPTLELFGEMSELDELPSLGGDIDPIHFMMEQNSTMLYFELVKDLSDEDKAILKALDYELKERVRYPQFRDLTPGFVPWHLADDKLDTLIHVVEQAVVLIQTARVSEAGLLKNQYPDDDEFFTATGTTNETGTYEWQYGFTQVDDWYDLYDEEEDDDDDDDSDNDDNDNVIPMFTSPAIVSARQKPQTNATFFMSYLKVFTASREKPNERPYYPILYLTLDSEDYELVGGAEMLVKNTGVPSDPKGSAERYLLAMVERLGQRPHELIILDEDLHDYLKTIARSLNIKITLDEYHEDANTAIDYLKQMLLSFQME